MQRQMRTVLGDNMVRLQRYIYMFSQLAGHYWFELCECIVLPDDYAMRIIRWGGGGGD